MCATNQFNNNFIAKSTTQKYLKWFKKYKCVLRLIKMKHYLLSYKHWAINKGAIIHITYPLLNTVKGDLWLCKVICLHTMKLVELITEINIF